MKHTRYMFLVGIGMLLNLTNLVMKIKNEETAEGLLSFSLISTMLGVVFLYIKEDKFIYNGEVRK